MMPRRWQADLALAGVALIWGSTFVLVKNALDEVSTALFLALRFGIAALVLGVALPFRRDRSPAGSSWKGGVLAGSFLFAGYLLQTFGLKLTTPAKSGFLTGLYIPLVPVFLAVLYRKLPLASECVGIAFAVLGMALMTLNLDRFTVEAGDLLTLGCAVAFAVHILLLGHYSRLTDTNWLTFLQIGTCAALAIFSMPVIEQPRIRWSVPVVVALSVTSLLATALAFFVQTWGQRHTTTTRTALIFALEPVFAWVTSFLFAGEVLTKQAVLGAVCILSGILFVELKPGWVRLHRLS